MSHYEGEVALLMPSYNLGPNDLGDKDYEVLLAHMTLWVRDNRKYFRSVPQTVREYVRNVNGRFTDQIDLLNKWDAHIAAIRATNLNDYEELKQYKSKTLTYAHGGFQWQ